MKVLTINGSPRPNGNTYVSLPEEEFQRINFIR